MFQLDNEYGTALFTICVFRLAFGSNRIARTGEECPMFMVCRSRNVDEVV